MARQEMPAKEPHIQCGPGDVAPVVLLPGDPGRIDWIARELEEVEEVASNREFRTITGRCLGVPVSAASTGIGGASTAIAVEELIRIGARILVRVGSAGALQPGMPIGSLVVAEGAVREDGASGMYVPAGYPAVADPELAVALAQAARELGVPVRSGLVRSHDSFYTDREEELTRSWAARGVLASDMETAALFTVARLRGVRAGSILNVVVTAEGELEEGINRLVASEEAAAAGQRASIQAALRGACRLWLEEKQR